MKWNMWYAHISGRVHKVGKTKDDLIDWLMGGYHTENYVWGATKADAIEEAKSIFQDWVQE